MSIFRDQPVSHFYLIEVFESMFLFLCFFLLRCAWLVYDCMVAS
uniref:Uncharacterized protein n=1 Tax=Rhizophora mucronata TaxID=61149 RepID=A0A2P2QYS3_RHIMU